MRTFPNLRNAPIVEAIIDLRVKQCAEFDLKLIDKIQGQVSTEYPESNPRFRLQSEIKFEDGEITNSSASQEIDGFVYTSFNGQRIFQAHSAGFTFSWLSPYTNWDDLYKEARKIWGIYRECTGAESITRIATRFINRLELPIPHRDLRDYLTSVPEIPPRLPQNLVNFMSRVVIPEPQNGALAVITQASQDPVISEEKSVMPILLDIDVFKVVHYEANDEKAWDMINSFRDTKNRIFFESITEKLENLYL